MVNKIVKKNKIRFKKLFDTYKSLKKNGYVLKYIDFYPTVIDHCRYVYPAYPKEVIEWGYEAGNFKDFFEMNILSTPSLLLKIELMNGIKKLKLQNLNLEEIKNSDFYLNWLSKYEKEKQSLKLVNYNMSKKLKRKNQRDMRKQEKLEEKRRNKILKLRR